MERKTIDEYTIGIYNGDYPIYCNLYPKNKIQEIEIKKLIDLGYAKKSSEKINIKCLTDKKYIKNIDDILNLHINDNKIKDINNYTKNKINGGDILDFNYLKNYPEKYPLNFHSFDNYNDNENFLEKKEGLSYNYISIGESYIKDKIISGIMCYDLGEKGEIYDCPYVLYHITFHPPNERYKEYEIHIQFSFYSFPLEMFDQIKTPLPIKTTLQLKYIFPLINKQNKELYDTSNQSLKFYLLKINEFLRKSYNSTIIINNFRFSFYIDNTLDNMKQISLNIQNLIGYNLITLYPYIILNSQITSGILNFSNFYYIYYNDFDHPSIYFNQSLDINKIIRKIINFNKNKDKYFKHFYFNDTNDITKKEFSPSKDYHYIIYKPPYNIFASSFIPKSTTFNPSAPSFVPRNKSILSSPSPQTKGGNINYKQKYLKYKLKYLNELNKF